MEANVPAQRYRKRHLDKTGIENKHGELNNTDKPLLTRPS